MSKVDTGRRTFGHFLAKRLQESEVAGNLAAGMDAGASPKENQQSNIASTRPKMSMAKRKKDED